jgi:hypothetical protein
MSVLETPRVLGEVTWDPIVTNNYADRYEETTAEPVFSAASDWSRHSQCATFGRPACP